jgi:hypothetical protein
VGHDESRPKPSFPQPASTRALGRIENAFESRDRVRRPIKRDRPNINRMRGRYRNTERPRGSEWEHALDPASVTPATIP